MRYISFIACIFMMTHLLGQQSLLDLVPTESDDGIEKAFEGLEVAATQLYTYRDGYLYEIITKKHFVTTIHLSPHEEILDSRFLASGEEAFFSIALTDGIVEGVRYQILLIKPLEINVSTNLIVPTTRRTYQLLLTSNENIGMYNVRWRYPGEVIETDINATADSRRNETNVTIEPINPEKINFNYAIKSIKRKIPTWTPTNVFDDGVRIYVRFPSSLQIVNLPTVLEVAGRARNVVNFRVVGEYYVLDSLYKHLEFIVEHERKTNREIVHVKRTLR